ncbi:MAG: hypothetical protein R8K22_04060 [Mariprofundaceae bacterium]
MQLRLAVLLVGILIGACATTPSSTSSFTNIGPYTDFTGRLLVIEPSRRWQVMIQWKGDPKQGWTRLTHAASGRIIELQWHNQQMQKRDNQGHSSDWHPITQTQLTQDGIILSPQHLAQVLSGKVPTVFKYKQDGIWEGHLHQGFIRIRWQANSRRLTMTDITHGRTATLIINE